jgi:hypothetical protein
MSDRLTEGYERLRAFAFTAAEDVDRPLRDDWRDALSDLAEGLDRIVRRDAHPDDVMYARLAMSDLVGVWLSVEETEALYLGEADRRLEGSPDA